MMMITDENENNDDDDSEEEEEEEEEDCNNQNKKEEMLTKELNLKYANGLPEYGKEINPNITAEEVDDSILPMLSSSVRHFIMINNGQ